MKRLSIILAVVLTLQACNNENPGESGAVDDGIKTVDENGALSDTTPASVDTLNKNRVDIQQRDTIRR